jgi:hypothetical protein
VSALNKKLYGAAPAPDFAVRDFATAGTICPSIHFELLAAPVAPKVVIGAVKFQSVASDCYSVAAEVAGSSLVVLAISSKRVRRLLENRRDTQENTRLEIPADSASFYSPNHFQRFALRLPLLAAESVGLDIHGDSDVCRWRGA